MGVGNAIQALIVCL